MRGQGLGRDWTRITETLREIIPFYDRVNRKISLGRDLKLRREAILRAVHEGDFVLDLGSGLGMMSKILLEVKKDVKDVVMCDALRPMLTHAGRDSTLQRKERVNALFESLPFIDSAFDLVMMGFALRDARRMDETLCEVERVLKCDGRLVVVDMGKPNNLLLEKAVSIYWVVVAPLIAIFELGRRGVLYHAIYETYRALPRNSELVENVTKLFPTARLHERLMGAAVILLGEKQ